MGKRTFIHYGEAYYWRILPRDPRLADEISLDVGKGEVFIRWHMLQQDDCPRLEIFSDGWRSLPLLKDVFAALAEFPEGPRTWEHGPPTPARPTPQEVCRLLLSFGFEDKTPRTDPYEHREGPAALCAELRELRGFVHEHAPRLLDAFWSEHPRFRSEDERERDEGPTPK